MLSSYTIASRFYITRLVAALKKGNSYAIKFQSAGKRYTPSWSVLPVLGFKRVSPAFRTGKALAGIKLDIAV